MITEGTPRRTSSKNGGGFLRGADPHVSHQEIFSDREIQIMPDCHTGSGCVIGFTSDMPRGGRSFPNLIGWGHRLRHADGTKIADSRTADDYAKLDKVIRRNACGSSSLPGSSIPNLRRGA